MADDYYQLLGVSRRPTHKEIQRAYRKLARKYHPDVNKERGAEDKFKQISEAYHVLSDSESRAQYDRFGPEFRQYRGGRARVRLATPGWRRRQRPQESPTRSVRFQLVERARRRRSRRRVRRLG